MCVSGAVSGLDGGLGGLGGWFEGERSGFWPGYRGGIEAVPPSS